MNKYKAYATSGAVMFFMFCLLLTFGSYEAVKLINIEAWHAVDYWLAWFSAITLLGAIVSAISFGVYFNDILTNNSNMRDK